MKKNCVICGEKASIWTRQLIKDGYLCGSCEKKCSEHIHNYLEMSSLDIKKHLAYRKENLESERLAKFEPTLSLGEYEILRIDKIHGYWLLKTEKRFNNINPDIFLLSQIVDVKLIQKKECLNGFNSSSNKKFQSLKNKFPIYGYWFYVVIKLNHPFFNKVTMRINKYIISEKNQIEYLGTLRNAQKITETIKELAKIN